MSGTSGESWVVTGPQIIEVEDVRALRVALVAGRVDVVGRDEPGARIEVHGVTGRPLEVGLVDGELRVGYAFTLGGWEGWLDKFLSWRPADRADVHVAVPRDVAVRLSTVSAEGFLGDVAQGAQVSTVSGSLVTDRTQGLLTVKAVSGDVVVRGHTGDLRANAVSGSVTASGAFTQASLTTVSGAVTLDAARAAGVSLQTVSGDATVRLPEGVGVTVAARSVSGRVVVDGEARTGEGPLTGNVEVTVGDGVCRIQANTVSGHLTVLRSAPVRHEGEY
ncbi:DUF4097 family beta strand repeat-containing protein [Actinotalea fermentans]|uniref:DUF4097 family beta strand repeat-containing protein n=1 Tax=Actinotalea fermentans TaxID=43671 RepID=UPI00054D3D73|nr:DUF4097 family beta strand repeat-containing protein [Actinotalea fermentans]